MVKKQAIDGKGYTQKAGQAKVPEIVIKKPEWEPALEALLKKGPGEGKKHCSWVDPLPLIVLQLCKCGCSDLI